MQSIQVIYTQNYYIPIANIALYKNHDFDNQTMLNI